jgi:ribosomal-protein-serine acetyltransferase
MTIDLWQPLVVDHDIELRPLRQSDSPALFALVEHDRDYLRRWQNWPDRIREVGDMRELVARSQKRAEYSAGFDFGLWYRERLAGKIGLVQIDWALGYTEIGYWVGAAYQGKGVVTRSCRALLDYTLVSLGLNRVNIRCAAGNLRSRAVPERLGFRRRGVMPHKIMLHGRLQEEVLYTMTAQQWRGRMIYHITTGDEWAAAQRSGSYRALSLETQGFIHLSTREQITRVADAIYGGQVGLVLLCIDPTRLRAELKYEPPDVTIPAEHYDGELFPHIYGAINHDAVVRVVDFAPGEDGLFSLPEGL